MEGCIYLIKCLVNGKGYIGQHKKPDPNSRFKAHIAAAKRGSNLFLHRAINLYGEENFTIERLCTCTHDALGRLEEYYAEQYGTYLWDPEPGYNMVWCGKAGRLGLKNDPEHIEKVRQANLGKKRSPEHIEKVRQANLGRKHSPEAIQKTRQGNLGRKHSPEAIERMRQARLGKKRQIERKPISSETREKMRQAKLGRKQSPEERQKKSDALRGRKQTSQHIMNARESRCLKKQAQNGSSATDEATDHLS